MSLRRRIDVRFPEDSFAYPAASHIVSPERLTRCLNRHHRGHKANVLSEESLAPLDAIGNYLKMVLIEALAKGLNKQLHLYRAVTGCFSPSLATLARRSSSNLRLDIIPDSMCVEINPRCDYITETQTARCRREEGVKT